MFFVASLLLTKRKMTRYNRIFCCFKLAVPNSGMVVIYLERISCVKDYSRSRGSYIFYSTPFCPRSLRDIGFNVSRKPRLSLSLVCVCLGYLQLVVCCVPCQSLLTHPIGWRDAAGTLELTTTTEIQGNSSQERCCCCVGG